MSQRKAAQPLTVDNILASLEHGRDYGVIIIFKIAALPLHGSLTGSLGTEEFSLVPGRRDMVVVAEN